VAPQRVCEVQYKEVTPDGVLRAPVFVRLRDDKDPQACRRRVAGRTEMEPIPADAGHEEPVVRFTNVDKLFWPDEGYRKSDLIQYYRGIARWLLPYLKDRPVVLTRFPDGIEGKSFFQKDAPRYVPDWIRTEAMWSEHAQREVRYFIVEDVEPLLYLANMGTIPLHVWSSRVESLERPDWCILDLDPKQAPFHNVVSIARDVHRLCGAIDLPCFVKTSGSTGLHVLIPLSAEYTYVQSRTLGELLARIVVQRLRDIATIVRAPKRREGKVYIHYLQNGHGRLLVSVFSARPLPGAPVSMPITWTQVTKRLRNDRFTIRNAAKHMRSAKTDPWLNLLDCRVDLAVALERLTASIE